MAIKIGTVDLDQSKIYIGTQEIGAVYVGANKVWPDAPIVSDEVIIGTQTWKVKNLDIDDGLGGIYAYNNDENNVSTYGRLYTWDAAVRVAASIDGMDYTNHIFRGGKCCRRKIKRNWYYALEQSK